MTAMQWIESISTSECTSQARGLALTILPITTPWPPESDIIGHCERTRAEIAGRMKCSVRTVSQHLAELESLGFVRRAGRGFYLTSRAS